MIIICQSLGSRPTMMQELFTHVLRLFGTTSRCPSVQPFQLPTLGNIWRHISLTWPFPHRYRHSTWPDLFPRFGCWTLIQLSRHRAWLCRGYWRYKSLFDWLIDWLWKAFTSWLHSKTSNFSRETTGKSLFGLGFLLPEVSSHSPRGGLLQSCIGNDNTTQFWPFALTYEYLTSAYGKQLVLREE